MEVRPMENVRYAHPWEGQRAPKETIGSPAMSVTPVQYSRPSQRPGVGLDQCVIDILNRFAVCYATFDESGRRLYLSPAAEALLFGDPHADILLAQASDVAQRAVAEPSRPARSPSEVGTAAGALRIPAGTRCAVSLEVRLVRQRSGQTVAVVIVQPQPYDRLAPRANQRSERLTEREQEVAHLLAAGKSTKQVAAALAISPHTARHHTERVYAKLGLRSRVALALALASSVGASSHTAMVPNGES